MTTADTAREAGIRAELRGLDARANDYPEHEWQVEFLCRLLDEERAKNAVLVKMYNELLAALQTKLLADAPSPRSH